VKNSGEKLDNVFGLSAAPRRLRRGGAQSALLKGDNIALTDFVSRSARGIQRRVDCSQFAADNPRPNLLGFNA
jgi:hypothetical protein